MAGIGQATLEYMGLIILVAVIIGAVSSLGLGTAVAHAVGCEIRRTELIPATWRARDVMAVWTVHADDVIPLGVRWSTSARADVVAYHTTMRSSWRRRTSSKSIR